MFRHVCFAPSGEDVPDEERAGFKLGVSSALGVGRNPLLNLRDTNDGLYPASPVGQLPCEQFSAEFFDLRKDDI